MEINKRELKWFERFLALATFPLWGAVVALCATLVYILAIAYIVVVMPLVLLLSPDIYIEVGDE